MKEKTKLQQLICQCRVGSVQQKANAIVELEEMGEQQAIPALLELLDFPDAAIRASAVEALGTLADLTSSDVGRALLPLLNDPESLVRANRPFREAVNFTHLTQCAI